LRHLVCTSLFIASLSCSAVATATETFSVAPQTEPTELAGQSIEVDVYRSSAHTIQATAIVAHGFTRSRARHRDLGQALAAAGITAVIPDLPFADQWNNSAAVVELVHKLEAGALGLAPIPRSGLVLIGTSAGGLATVLAAAKLPGLAGWVGLDPVDRTGSGIQAASRVTSPAVVLLAERSGCNLYGSGRSIARAIPGLLRSTLLHGASHCDFEGPSTKLCRLICGESPVGMRALARDATVTAAVEMLRGRSNRPIPTLNATPE